MIGVFAGRNDRGFDEMGVIDRGDVEMKERVVIGVNGLVMRVKHSRIAILKQHPNQSPQKEENER